MRQLSALVLVLATCCSVATAQSHPPRLLAPTPIGPVPVQYGPVIVGPPVVVQPPYVTTYPPYPRPVPYTFVPAAATQPRPVTTTVRRVEPPLPSAPLVVEIGEGFANRLLRTRRVENAPIQDIILDAAVQGWRQTTTNVSVDFVPSTDGARFDVQATGTNQSDTLGATDRATVRTLGNQSFSVNKPVLFNGRKFLVQRARGAVNPSNQTVGAWTRYDDVPILGRIANRTAYRKANERRPVTERISADRLAQQLIPRFNKEVNDQLTKANGQLESQRKTLTEKGLWPTRSSLSSTSQRLRWAAWFGESDDFDARPALASRDDGCALALHESLVNGFVERLELGGRVFQPADLEEALKSLPDSVATEQPIPQKEDPQAAMAALVKFVFDEDRPMSMRFEDGKIVVAMRIRVRPAVGPDIGPHDVRIALAPRVKEREIVLAPTSVAVRPVTPSEAGAEQVAQLLQTRLKERVPTMRLGRSMRLPDPFSGKAATLAGVSVGDGWATFSVR